LFETVALFGFVAAKVYSKIIVLIRAVTVVATFHSKLLPIIVTCSIPGDLRQDIVAASIPSPPFPFLAFPSPSFLLLPCNPDSWVQGLTPIKNW